mgnify:CR=1 FL=1
MSLNKNSNLYVFLFSAGVTAIVGIALAVAATSLKERQEKNIALEKKGQILSAVGFTGQKSKIETAYQEYITPKAISPKGKELEGVDPFDLVPEEQQKIAMKNPSESALPLYVFEKDGDKCYILPLVGKGLWGPISGYLAIEKDLKTIRGVTFDHESETPGLGAEITTEWFQEQFENKKIRNDKQFTSVEVLKGTGNNLDAYSVDGISGATITAKGVDKMLREDIQMYLPYFENAQNVKISKL